MHFLQSNAWEKFQQSLGRKVFRESGDGWEYLAVLETGKGNSRLYCPYGPHAEKLEAFERALDSLKSLGKSENVSFIRIEPIDANYLPYLKQQSWQKVSYQSLNPEHTNIIDLSPAPDELVANMSSSIRNIYRNYHKKGVEVHRSNDPRDIEIFLEFIHQVADRTGVVPHSDQYFKDQAKVLFPTGEATIWYATQGGIPIASAVLFDGDDTRYNAYAGASSLPEHRRLKPATALLAEAILDAKAKGLKYFDMYGVAPIDAPKSHPWAGFSEFKRSFGGKDIDFAGSWDLPINKIEYQIYRSYQKLRKLYRDR